MYQKMPVVCMSHLNESCSGDNSIDVTLSIISFHTTVWWPISVRQKSTSGTSTPKPKTEPTAACLFQMILKNLSTWCKARYHLATCPPKNERAHHCQPGTNRIGNFFLKLPCSLPKIGIHRPALNGRKRLLSKYLLWSSDCQMPSSVSSLKSHLLSRGTCG